MVEAQKDTVRDIEKQAQKIEVDTGAGLVQRCDAYLWISLTSFDRLRHEEEAVRHAKSARRKRWIMFFIFLICLAILAIVLGVVLGKS